MADANTEVDLTALHSAIRDALAAQFPDYQTVEFYRDIESEQIPTPALLLELCDVEVVPDADAQTGQLPVLLRFEARVIMADRDAATSLAIRLAACSLAAFLRLKRWPGQATDAAHVIACEPDEFTPNNNRHKVWRVEWVQGAMLGASVWKNDGVVPESLFSFAPVIGTPNEPAYTPVMPDPLP